MTAIPMRLMTARDRRFVVPTWAESARGYGMRKSERFDLVDRLLDGGSVGVVVLATDERTVHAWAAGEIGVLHYVYVAPELRGNGFARQAITEVLGDYPEHINVTHPWPRASSRFRYRPHLIARTAA